jgi:hypothetical protein
LNNPIIPLPLEYGDKKSLLEDSYCHLQVISRAALLLFLSTLASRKLLVNAAISKDTLSFWWKHHGVERALWKNGNLPNDPLDLWKDIDTAIADSRTWRNLNPSGSVSIRDWREDQSNALNNLGGFELIGMLGLLS